MKKSLHIAIAIAFCSIALAQTSNVTITVNWSQWSSENKIELYNPTGNLINPIISNGYDGAVNNNYTYSENYGALPNLTGYTVKVFDFYGDDWNGNGSMNIIIDGVTAFQFDGDFDNNVTTGNPVEISKTFNFEVRDPQPGDQIFDSRGKNYIEYIKGNLPIIISAAHGGVLLSGQTIGGTNYPDNDTSLPDRTCGNNERDDNTEILIREIQDEIFALTGCYAHVIINNLHRSKLDPNRIMAEATCGDTDAEFYWNAFHNFIDDASIDVETSWGKGLYIDLHGQSHAIARVELGYNITANELNTANLNTISGTSITNLVANNLGNIDQEQLVRGSQSLGTLLKNTTATFYNNNVNPGCGVTSGYRALPSNFDSGASNACDDTRPLSNLYFNGNYYNNERHGSGQSADDGLGGGGTIDGIMSEVNRRVRDLGTYKGNVYDTRPQTLVPFAQDYAAVILDYINIHYNDFTNFSYAANTYDTSDADAIPTISGISGGVFSSTTGLVIDAASGVIDTSASTVGNYVVTYEAGACGFYASTRNVEITDNTLSVDTLENVTFKIYPNPTNGYVKFESNKEISKVKIVNFLGQEIQTVNTNAKQAEIDLSKLANGSYLMTFYIDGELVNSKMVIKN